MAAWAVLPILVHYMLSGAHLRTYAWACCRHSLHPAPPHPRHTAGAQWEKAQEVFEQMTAGGGCRPDVVTYTALISALEKGGQWRLALSVSTVFLPAPCC